MPDRPSRLLERGIQTREQILRVARRLFTEQGYHRTSIYDLFDDAGITKGAFFHHWKSKEELALSILEGLKADFDRHFFLIGDGPGRAREKIDRLLLRIDELNNGQDWSYTKLFAIWCAELDANEAHLGPAMHKLQVRWYRMWKDLITRAQAEKDLRADISPENLTFLVVSAICGVQLMSRKGCAPGGAKTACESLRRTILT
jgi:AcrR family transcriptional regulator